MVKLMAWKNSELGEEAGDWRKICWKANPIYSSSFIMGIQSYIMACNEFNSTWRKSVYTQLSMCEETMTILWCGMPVRPGRLLGMCLFRRGDVDGRRPLGHSACHVCVVFVFNWPSGGGWEETDWVWPGSSAQPALWQALIYRQQNHSHLENLLLWWWQAFRSWPWCLWHYLPICAFPNQWWESEKRPNCVTHATTLPILFYYQPGIVWLRTGDSIPIPTGCSRQKVTCNLYSQIFWMTTMCLMTFGVAVALVSSQYSFPFLLCAFLLGLPPFPANLYIRPCIITQCYWWSQWGRVYVLCVLLAMEKGGGHSMILCSNYSSVVFMVVYWPAEEEHQVKRAVWLLVTPEHSVT